VNGSLSLLIPVYNEENNLPALLERLVGVDWGMPCQMVFVDDRSKDNSWEILNAWIARHPAPEGVEFTLHRQEKNRGKGAALHRAIELAKHEVCIVQDADFEYDPTEIPMIVEPIRRNKADVVYGSRFKKNALQVHRTYHYFVNRLLTLLSNLLSGLYFTDMETCYKAIRTEILKNLNLTTPRFGFEVEVTAHLARLRARFAEVAISYTPRNYLEGKKITWRDGLAAVFHILRYNLFFSDRKRFKSSMPSKYLAAGSQWL
jgi:glycosyltransferase involved in cell wall biosynthesis